MVVSMLPFGIIVVNPENKCGRTLSTVTIYFHGSVRHFEFSSRFHPCGCLSVSDILDNVAVAIIMLWFRPNIILFTLQFVYVSLVRINRVWSIIPIYLVTWFIGDFFKNVGSRLDFITSNCRVNSA